jgi:hypothetical protein
VESAQTPGDIDGILMQRNLHRRALKQAHKLVRPANWKRVHRVRSANAWVVKGY